LWIGDPPLKRWAIIAASSGRDAAHVGGRRADAVAMTMVYLSNMYEHGADNCANEIFDSWFALGTIYDDALTSPNGPAPGYVPGGANPSFVQDSAYTGPRLAPPLDQPIQKSYKD